jgi:3-oxoacyl-[acyl-carrier protein] reductase
MRKVLILGGSGDIGFAISNEFGSDNIICASSKDVDLSNKDSVNQFIQLTGSSFDIIIHSAGLNVVGSFETISIDNIEQAIQTNLTGFLPIVQNNIPHWKKTGNGRLIIISSLYGIIARHGRLPYVISKHGLIGLVKTLAIELGKYGTTVNAVSPGYINTKMTAKNNNAETINKIIKGIPIGRMGHPAEIAKAVSFLASIDASYINGHDLVVDGGHSIGGFNGDL